MTSILAVAAAEFLPYVLGGMALLIPIVFLLTHHQRKMAEVLRKPEAEAAPAILDEVRQLRNDLSSMRSELNANTIAVDDLRKRVLTPPESPEALEQRIEE